MATTSDTTAPVAPAPRVAGHWLENPRVTLTTTLGSVVFELFPNSAPVTVANWLAYVNTDFLDGLLFHRVMPGFVVQGGGFASGLNYRTPSYSPIPLESNNGRSNVRGTLAMARTDAPHSATSQFYVNLADNTFLNYASSTRPGYAVFGSVVSGMATIDAIARVPTTTRSGMANVPVTEVQIGTATQSRAGVVHSTTGMLGLTGLETGATRQYSLDGGTHWTTLTGATLTLPAGAYEAGQVQVRQRDAAGNLSGIGLPGADIIVDTRTPIPGNAAANRLTGTAGADAIYGLGGADTLNGGNGNDTLNGGSGNDTLDGGSGNDTLIGGTGNDVYSVRDTGDRVTEAAGGGTDTVYSYLTAYTLPANVERGRIMSGAGANLAGNALSNVLYAGPGNNVLSGGTGTESDTVSYRYGTTGTQGVTVFLSLTAPWATGGSGTDTLTGIENLTGSPNDDRLGGSTGNNTLDGGAGNDTLSGWEGNDTLIGGDGNDFIDGGTGNDTLIGGAGSDTLGGGSGSDNFRFLTPSEGADILIDFASGTDRLQVVSTNFGLPVGTLAAGRLVTGRTPLTGTTPVFIYEAATGALGFDSNGRTAGGLTQIALLTGGRTLVASDIQVVAA